MATVESTAVKAAAMPTVTEAAMPAAETQSHDRAAIGWGIGERGADTDIDTGRRGSRHCGRRAGEHQATKSNFVKRFMWVSFRVTVGAIIAPLVLNGI